MNDTEARELLMSLTYNEAMIVFEWKSAANRQAALLYIVAERKKAEEFAEALRRKNER